MKTEINYGTGQAGRLREAVHAFLLSIEDTPNAIPTSSRFIYYEMRDSKYASVLFGARDRRQGRRSVEQNITDALTFLREKGHIPWEWISDETRMIHLQNDYADLKEAVTTAAWGTINAWGEEDGGVPPMVICETAALAGPIYAGVEDYQVPVVAVRGWTKGFLMTEVGPALKPWQPVLYIGDHDKRGHMIEADIRDTLNNVYQPKDGQGLDLTWERIAVTESQIEEYGLEIQMKPDKVLGEAPAVECEALTQAVVIEIVRDKLAWLYPEDIEETQAREERQRKQVQEHLAKLKLVD